MSASLIIPTYQEGKNLQELTERVFNALKKAKLPPIEMIVVDDNSQDNSTEIVEKLSAQYPIRIVVRTKERGLSSAVLCGFADASEASKYFIVMDADLQHPPEKLPEVLTALFKGYDFVLGTRYGGGTTVDKDWPIHRKILSAGARMMARPLTPLSDPMSGFFAISRTAFNRGVMNINPIGYKIALECFVKCKCVSLKEIPINFGVRMYGESKLGGKVLISYIIHLIQLYSYQFPVLLPFLMILFLLIVLILLFF